MMNEAFLRFVLPLVGKEVVLTPWKIIGITGALMFAARWFVQAWASKKAGRSVVPLTFWAMSIGGSALTLSYFIFGKNDAVGILQNVSPFFLALYNVWLELKRRGESERAVSEK
jgi:lipid-A-disaccharide synthase-like uncharacterized protein